MVELPNKKKILFILLILAFFLLILRVWSLKDKIIDSEKCVTRKCRDDIVFIESAYKEQWDEYYKELEKETIQENEFLRCITKANSRRCETKDKSKFFIYDRDKDMLFAGILATTSVPLPPSSQFQIAGLNRFNNECKSFFCRTSYDDKIANIRKYLERTKHE